MPSRTRQRFRPYRAAGMYWAGPPSPAQQQQAQGIRQQLIADHLAGNEPSAGQAVVLSLLSSAVARHSSVTGFLRGLPHPWCDKKRRTAWGVLHDLSRLEKHIARLLSALVDPSLERKPAEIEDLRSYILRKDAEAAAHGESLDPTPSLEIGALRMILSRRRHFIRIQVAEVNAVKRLLRGAGRDGACRARMRTDAHWERLLASGHIPGDLDDHVRHHYAVWRQAAERVRTLDLTLGMKAKERRDVVTRLETVPGVGPIVALTTIAVFAEVSRFPSAKHAASYSGLVPSTFQSGDRDAHGHITKRGSAELRTMLCEAAHHARRPTHPLNPHFVRVAVRRGHKAAVVAVAHRLCRILFAMLRDGSEFDPARIGVEEGHFTRAVAYKYRFTPKPAGRLPAAS